MRFDTSIRQGWLRPLTSEDWIGLGAATAGVAAMTGCIQLLAGAVHLANVSLLYLLVVIGTALRFGSAPAILASVLAFLAFDWFFVEPRYQFTVNDPDEWLALVMFLVTATVTGQLTALLRTQAEQARQREREATALAEASWAVASQLNRDRALAEVLRRLASVVGLRATAIVVRAEPGLSVVIATGGEQSKQLPEFAAGTARDAAEYVLEKGLPIAWGTERHYWDKALADVQQSESSYLPLTVEHRVLGVLYLWLQTDQAISVHKRRVVESLATHAAVVLERERLTRAETQARALAEADRLKTALLSMVSHDFRSPLASIKASVTGLLQEGAPWETTTQRELLLGVNQETDRLNRMVGNILALSRLEADAWRPQCELTPLAEVVGATLDSFSAADNRRIRVHLDPESTEAWLDPVQVVQVLHNLVDNALKYSPSPAMVDLQALRRGATLTIEVLDRGPGLPPGDESRIFERFYRAPDLRESAVPGVGIGLAVCRGLVEAHGGQLTAQSRDGGGAVFRITLPLSARGSPTVRETVPS